MDDEISESIRSSGLEPGPSKIHPSSEFEKILFGPEPRESREGVPFQRGKSGLPRPARIFPQTVKICTFQRLRKCPSSRLFLGNGQVP